MVDIDAKSSDDYDTSGLDGEPFAPEAAKALIRSILKDGRFVYSPHAQDAFAKRNISTVDVVNVLRGGVVRPGECERGTWRYQVHTGRLTVVVAFRSEAELVVVTAWRIRQ